VPLSQNLGALTSWNPLGLSRPVMGLLYLFTISFKPFNYRYIPLLLIAFKIFPSQVITCEQEPAQSVLTHTIFPTWLTLLLPRCQQKVSLKHYSTKLHGVTSIERI
jgi:hypothetical protein